MLVITQLQDKRLAVKCDYFYRSRICKIPTAYFNHTLKQWILESYMLGTLEKEFEGELVYKTPRWVILNEPMPDMSKMYEITDKSIKCPSLKLQPYDYQDYGIRFMIDKLLKHNMVLNSDSVGLGKTICTIGTLKWFIENKGYSKILIICKKSIKRQWKNEFNKFTDLEKTFNIVYTEESLAKRKKAYDTFDNSTNGILITNYHNFLNDTDLIKSLDYDIVVIDEVHSVKARTGKLNNNIASAVQGKPVIFLTGTPIMSKPEDIFGIIQIADPNYFGKWKDFSKEYLVYGMTNFGMKLVGAKNLNKLRQKVQDILIRRTEYEVSIKLPKIRNVRKDCNMDNVQFKILQMISEDTMEIQHQMNNLKGPDGKIKNQQMYDMLEGRSKGLIAARQAACTDPRMFLYSNSKMMRDKYGAEVPKSYKSSDKMESILDLVEDITQEGSKVIIFSKFRTSACLAAQDINDNLKVPVLMYTGTENQETRDDNIALFEQSVDHNVLIGTDAMAEGLNLQIAKYIINIDQPDTYAIKDQRSGRIRRVGSKFNNVIMYDMITNSLANAKSKDEERLDNIEKNKDVSDALVSIDESQRQALINSMKGN